MNSEVKAKWLTALRSGEYEQTKGWLNVREDSGTDQQFRKAGHCCLGVLCDIAVKDGIIPEPEAFDYADGPKVNSYWDMDMTLPSEVVDWAGTHDENPMVKGSDLPADEEGTGRSLAELNDAGYTFAQIADIIEEQL